MATIRAKEFANFVINNVNASYGELHMNHNHVYSYNTQIAHIDRENKVIYFHSRKYSRTTSAHQNAILVGFKCFLPTGWTLNSYEKKLGEVLTC